MLSNPVFKLIYLCLYAIPTCSKTTLFGMRIKCRDYTETTAGTVYFNYKGLSYKTSKDLMCLKNNQIFIRLCNTNTGNSIPDIVECNMKKNKNSYCADELFEIRRPNHDTICIKIATALQAYDEQFCYGSNVIIPTDLTNSENSKVTQFLIKKNISDYWFPVRRYNAFIPFEVRLAGKSWRKVVNRNLIQLTNKSDEHCLRHSLNKRSTNNSRNVIVTENCKTFLNTVCIFISQLISIAGWPNGFGALIFRPHESYGIDWRKKTKMHVYAKEYLKKRNWLRTIFTNIDYFSDHFGNKYNVLMNTFKMVKVINLKWNPALSKRITKSKNPVKMVLKMDGKSNTLIIVVYNRNYLWVHKEPDVGVKCFTYAKYGFLKNANVDLIWENKEKTYSIIVDLVSSFRSEYWREVHTILDFQLVSTRRLTVVKYKQSNGFFVHWNVSCIHKNNLCYTLRMDFKVIIKKLRRLISSRKKQRIFNEFEVRDVRIMNIEYTVNLLLFYLIHITASLKISSAYNSVEVISHNDESGKINTFALKRIKVKLNQLLKDFSKNSKFLIRSRDYCFPQRYLSTNGVQIHLNIAHTGELGSTNILCIKKNGMPHTRLCQGDFLHGDHWTDLKKPVLCEIAQSTTLILHKLMKTNMLKSSPVKVLRTVKQIIKEKKKNLLPPDILLISNIIQDTVKSFSSNVSLERTNRGSITWRNIFSELMNIYNLLASIDLRVIKMSAELNATNKLIESVEHAFDTFSTISFFNKIDFVEDKLASESDNEFIDYEDIGVSVQVSEFILYFSISPKIANVSGIALFKNNKTEEIRQKLKGLFINEHYRFLQSNHEISDFVINPNFQLGVYLPLELLDSLKAFSDLLASSTSRNDPTIVIKVYSNDKLFQQSTKTKTILSRIVSVSLPGYSSVLPVPFPLILRKTTSYDVNKSGSCQYWNYGEWSSDGVLTPNHSDTMEGIALCLLSHLTPFAYIVEHNISNNKDSDINEEQFHEDGTDIIIIACCLISLMVYSSFLISLKHLFIFENRLN
ncbi:uncharacterized protein LOC121467806 [Drosophila elegans]|uniref:uncharacterized protein LOC121467806 n=1 Tax=Drosophila elegans TaxID=30023 RepID=UPI001BC8367F|nr:uncharacterized protein LOC121467806 [Drosophila elegans]